MRALYHGLLGPVEDFVCFSTRSVGMTLTVAFKPRLPIPKRIFRRVSDD
jgi:hypothetical protein